MRIFVGLPVPEPLVAPLLQLQEEIPVGRPVPEENLHLTLAFPGEIAEAEAVALHEALDARRLPPCTLAPGGLSTYGGDVPKLLALDIRPEPDLAELQKGVARAAAQAGLRLERRRFRPHVTLLRFGSGLRPDGRARLHRALEGLVLPRMAPAEVRTVRLYRSTLSPDGAAYDVLAEYLLR